MQAIQGTMMQSQLTITQVLRHAESINADSEIVSVTYDNPRHRYTYKDAFKRSRQLANALANTGCQKGERIATLAWNDHRHFELYYGVSCSGMVLHTINPRLFPEQIEYIVNHAQDSMVFLDPQFIPLIDQLKSKLNSVKKYIVLCDYRTLTELGADHTLYTDYESFIDSQSSEIDWPELEENAPSSMCYTSGTTGMPKGVVYTHRSTILHSMASAMPDAFNVSCRETILPVVPMFHVNGWGLAYTAPMNGAKLVLPGNKMADGETLTDLVNREGVTMMAGVPTVWLALLDYLKTNELLVPKLQRIIVGGAACPSIIIEQFKELFDVSVHQAWGMTEMSPLGTFNAPVPALSTLSAQEQQQVAIKQGRPIFGVELRIDSPDQQPLPWDGEASGSLKVRGPWVASSYFGQDSAVDENGFFSTGDVASIDKLGYMQIMDREKDVIKSGGEWISSIELENIASSHQLVKEAAVIGVPHPKWTERPLLIIVPTDSANQDQSEKDDILAMFDGVVARFCKPDAIEFADSLPHTATGKLSKKDLRQQFIDYQLDTDGA